MKKPSFDHWSHTAKRFFELTCGSHILPLLLCAWIFESLKYAMKSLEILYKWLIQSSLHKKLNLDYSAQILLLFKSVLYFTYIASRAFSVVSLLIWKVIILNQNNLKLCRSHRITGCPWKKQVLTTDDTVAKRCLSWPGALTFYHFFYVPEFLKVWKLPWNHLKLCTNDRFSLCC